MIRISLNHGSYANLLQLRQVSCDLNNIQNILSSGNKVNSAIDNPSSYYTARALNNRAADLSALLDNMGQALSVVKAATTGLETSANILEQASAIAVQALEKTDETINCTFVDSVTSLKAALADNSATHIVVTQSLTFADNDFITIGTGKTLEALNSNIVLNFTDTGTQNNIKAVKNDGTLQNITINFTRTQETGRGCAVYGGTLDGIVNIKAQGYQNAGVNSSNILGTANIQTNGYVSSGVVACSINGTANIFSSGYYSSGMESGKVYGTVNILTDGMDANGCSGCTEIYGTANIITLQYASEALQSSTLYGTLNAITKQEKGFYPSNLKSGSEVNICSAGNLFNHPNNVKEGVLIHFNKLNSTSDTLYEYYMTEDQPEMTDSLLESYKTDQTYSKQAFIESLEKTIDDAMAQINSPQAYSDDKIVSLYQNAQRYAGTLSQMDDLINDSSYQGVNLLKGENLSVNFNESRSSGLDIYGKDMRTNTLGLTTLNWQTQGDIAQSLKEISSALNQIRDFQSTLGNNYSILNTRSEFTQALTDILEEGADKLTLADMNEASADMLALQTRQQLAINALSLATQAEQGVLRLF